MTIPGEFVLLYVRYYRDKAIRRAGNDAELRTRAPASATRHELLTQTTRDEVFARVLGLASTTEKRPGECANTRDPGPGRTGGVRL